MENKETPERRQCNCPCDHCQRGSCVCYGYVSNTDRIRWKTAQRLAE